jgi:replicative DNA helicase
MSRAYSPTASPPPRTPTTSQAPSMADDDLPRLPFPLEVLPGAAGDMARSIVDAERVPESLAGVSVLGIVSASIGAGLQIRSSASRVTPGNLYILASADSGTGKSQAFRHAARPFMEYEAEIVKRWKMETLPGLQAERETLDAEIQRLKKDAGKADDGMERERIRQDMEQRKARLLALDAEMQSPVLSVEDVTTERLAVLLSKRGECLASLSPDAVAIVANLLGRYNRLDRTDEGIYLKAFSRDFIRVDRQSRDPVFLQEPCLAVLWLTQPDKLEILLGERSLTDGGLIPRLLPCHTNAQPQHVDPDAPGILQSVLDGYRQLVHDLLTEYRLARESRIIIPSPAAMTLLTDYHNAIVDRRKNELKDVTSYAARWAEQAWRISVVLHAAEYGRQAHDHELTHATAIHATEMMDWFAAQQLDILSGGRWKAQRDRRNEVLSLFAEMPDGITARDVYRARICRDADEARLLLASMETEGVLLGNDVTPERGGWPHRIYTRKPTR